MQDVNWTNTLFLISYHLFVIIAVPWYFATTLPSLGIVLSAILLLLATSFSITLGYHRLFSHRSYKTTPLLQSILLFFGALAIQNSALKWSHDHRVHHAHVDTEKDPYSIKKGFWYAHMLWIFKKSPPMQVNVVKDLMRNKRIMFQYKHYLSLAILGNIATFLLAGFLFADYLGAFLIVLWLRLFVSHHLTFLINSAAHTWGSKQFSKEHSAVNNHLLAFFTFGEGYHNFHHTFPSDYRNGVRWYQFDPTKWIIWTLHQASITRDLIRTASHTIKSRMIKEDKHVLLEHIRHRLQENKEELARKVEELHQKVIERTIKLQTLLSDYKQLRKERTEKKQLKRLKLLIKQEKNFYHQEWRSWCVLFKTIMRA